MGSVTGRRPTVLVIDDHDDIRLALEYLLTDEGFEVSTAANGAEGLDCAKRVRPAVILLDQSMPKVDGKGFVDELRKDPSIAAIPVIVMSAIPMLEPERVPPVFGGFFQKPFDIEALVKALWHWSGSVGLAALLGFALPAALGAPHVLDADEGSPACACEELAESGAFLGR